MPFSPHRQSLATAAHRAAARARAPRRQGVVAGEAVGVRPRRIRTLGAIWKLLAPRARSRCALHRALEAGLVHEQAALARDVRREVHREAEGVVELEHRVAVEPCRPPAPRASARGWLHAVFERLARSALPRAAAPRRLRALDSAQFRIGLAHGLGERADQLVEERSGFAPSLCRGAGAADDPAQHVAAALVRGSTPSTIRKAQAPDVVGDHPQRGIGGIGGRSRARHRGSGGWNRSIS
jgi:hypothetical protein